MIKFRLTSLIKIKKKGYKKKNGYWINSKH